MPSISGRGVQLLDQAEQFPCGDRCGRRIFHCRSPVPRRPSPYCGHRFRNPDRCRRGPRRDRRAPGRGQRVHAGLQFSEDLLTDPHAIKEFGHSSRTGSGARDGFSLARRSPGFLASPLRLGFLVFLAPLRLVGAALGGDARLRGFNSLKRGQGREGKAHKHQERDETPHVASISRGLCGAGSYSIGVTCVRLIWVPVRPPVSQNVGRRRAGWDKLWRSLAGVRGPIRLALYQWRVIWTEPITSRTGLALRLNRLICARSNAVARRVTQDHRRTILHNDSEDSKRFFCQLTNSPGFRQDEALWALSGRATRTKRRSEACAPDAERFVKRRAHLRIGRYKRSSGPRPTFLSASAICRILEIGALRDGNHAPQGYQQRGCTKAAQIQTNLMPKREFLPPRVIPCAGSQRYRGARWVARPSKCRLPPPPR